jgi:hypothetical protein
MTSKDPKSNTFQDVVFLSEGNQELNEKRVWMQLGL